MRRYRPVYGVMLRGFNAELHPFRARRWTLIGHGFGWRRRSTAQRFADLYPGAYVTVRVAAATEVERQFDSLKYRVQDLEKSVDPDHENC